MKTLEYFLLTPETASDDLIGYEVTIGINDTTPTQYGTIEKFSEGKIHVRIGNSVKKFDFDPHNVILQVYQFKKGVRFVSKAEMEYDEQQSQNKEARQQSGAKKVGTKKKGAKKKSKPKQKPKNAIEWS